MTLSRSRATSHCQSAPLALRTCVFVVYANCISTQHFVPPTNDFRCVAYDKRASLACLYGLGCLEFPVLFSSTILWLFLLAAPPPALRSDLE